MPNTDRASGVSFGKIAAALNADDVPTAQGGKRWYPATVKAVVSGQDAEVPSIKSMLRGEQYSTIFKDTRDLAKVTADMVDAALSGKTVTVNDTKTYNNGVKVVPSYLLKPVVVDKTNWEKVLIDGGYYKKAQIN